MPPRSKRPRTAIPGSSQSSGTIASVPPVASGAHAPSLNPAPQGAGERSAEQRQFLEEIRQSRVDWGSAQIFPFQEDRVRSISAAVTLPSRQAGHAVAYWMSRDCRVQDNWALIYAQRIALQEQVPLHIVFCLTPKFADATIRAYKFLLGGLQEVQQECSALDIGFHLLIGYAKDVLPTFLRERNIPFFVCDFNPLRGPLGWVEDVKQRIGAASFVQVDAHNIVPCWVASDKEEAAARTIRGKLHKRMEQFHTPFPPVVKHPFKVKLEIPVVDWQAAEASLEVDRTVDSVQWAKPGTENGLIMLFGFLTQRLKNYAQRNDPNVAALSDMSPWFHFGQVAVARAILEGERYIRDKARLKPGFEVFFEEAIIRRELSDNFCFYNKNYDNLNGAKQWAKLSLEKHAIDPRPIVYSQQQLEEARTHDDLWNAAQVQMNRDGKLHGFLRMYWAKKILEWTADPAEALRIAICLNDKYNLDGRDCNGYVGCMWSICGVHDMGWKEREIFGKIRYMNYAGCQRKFDVPAFVNKYKRYFPEPIVASVTY
ncbi:deoxyribodipyrimidine photo-lyase-like isoform X2 [Paramacrobiotus metropolitanus]|nr:deoxyribodipyrimidine photo-lyase-like isoform X2 [Paramacrobiotus metropolitanus]